MAGTRFPIEMQPGLYAIGTALQAAGRFHDSDMVRWQGTALKPIGGFQLKNTDPDETVRGVARAILPWIDNDAVSYVGIGTHSNLYALDRGGFLTDITPIRATASLTDPFATTNGSAVVTVTDTAHGATTGDEVVISGASAVAGLTLDGAYELTKVDADSYTINAGSNANATASGGGTVAADYRINVGLQDSDFRGGYGNDTYGSGPYGTPRGDTIDPNDVTVWSLEVFGQNLVCCHADNEVIYLWDRDSNPAEAIVGAPTARAVHVTAEGALCALGANGNPRLVKHSDLNDETTWSPTTTNEAREFTLQAQGKLMCGRQVRGGSLLLTNADVWLMEFIGFPDVYAYNKKGGAGTGIVAQGAIATIDGEAVPIQAMWMGPQGFFGYDGAVVSIPCSIADRVFKDINRSQISKTSAFHNADYGEVWFLYASGSSIEIDRAAIFNYRENWWALSYSIPRTCGCEKGPLANPLAISFDGDRGEIFEHEIGFDYDGAAPYAETAPMFVGEGARTITIDRIIPDEETLGDVQVTIYGRMEPNGTLETFGPYTLSPETDIGVTVRYFHLRFTGVRTGPWRVGRFGLEGKLRGRQ